MALHAAGAQDVIYGSFFDAALAAEAHKLGKGARFVARFNRDRGQAPWEQWDLPFEAEAEVVGLTDGRFIGRLGLLQGRKVNLGKSAALRIGGLTVVVISARNQTADPMFFEMFGIDIGKARTVVVKSRGHFRAGFRPWFPPEQVKEVDTAGLTSPVLERLPFEGLPSTQLSARRGRNVGIRRLRLQATAPRRGCGGRILHRERDRVGSKHGCDHHVDGARAKRSDAHSVPVLREARLPGSAGTGLAHGFVLACWFRNAASPASDTSTHFLSGAASAT